MTDKDDDARWIETVLEGLNARSGEVKQALLRRIADGQTSLLGSMPLLGLELTNTENKQENAEQTVKSDPAGATSPLLGTISRN